MLTNFVVKSKVIQGQEYPISKSVLVSHADPMYLKIDSARVKTQLFGGVGTRGFIPI